MKNYKHIYFDLDHTLWDFDKNCAETLEELHNYYEFSKLGIESSQLIKAYQKINYQMWYEYNRGRLTKEQIRKERFANTFELLGLNRSFVPGDINEKFLEICPSKGNVLPYTHEVLTYLYDKKYSLHIITNGFKDTQHVKISSSNLSGYFNTVINSEICGYAKPDKQIFDYARSLSNAEPEECVMIGDDLFTDVQGAANAGLDSVYFNPKKERHQEKVTFEISCLSELKTIF